ncbi:hypothetical protein BST61_g11577 [Cercospora zeina]
MSPPPVNLEAQTDLALAVSELVTLYIKRNNLLSEAKKDEKNDFILQVVPEISFIGWGKADTWPEGKQRLKTEALRNSIEQTRLETEILEALERLKDVTERLLEWRKKKGKAEELEDSVAVAALQDMLEDASSYDAQARKVLFDCIEGGIAKMEGGIAKMEGGIAKMEGRIGVSRGKRARR